MFIKNLKIIDFRNYENCNIDANEKINIIYGNNAQGKTNLVEAIYIFSTSKSHRTKKDLEMIKFNKNFFKVSIMFNNIKGENSGQIIYESKKNKRIRINGIPIKKISDLMGFFNVVIFSPETMDIIKEGPSERRKFIDILISGIKPTYFHNLQSYLKVIKQKNSILKNMESMKGSDKILDIYNEKLSEFATEIIYQRYTFIKRIEKEAKKIHKVISDGKENLQIEYLCDFNINDFNDKNEIKSKIIEKLKESKKREIKFATSSIGPHREDIKILINEKDARSYSSQGQKRTSIFSLKMAELEIIKQDIGEYPVLILDDILSELDNKRKNYIIECIDNMQVFITCTNKDDFKTDKKVSYFYVNNGIIKEV